MRVSVDKDDSGYHWACRGTKVFLNGEPCQNAVTADEERGEVTVLVKGLGPVGHMRRDVLRGKVTLELSSALQAAIGSK